MLLRACNVPRILRVSALFCGLYRASALVNWIALPQFVCGEAGLFI